MELGTDQLHVQYSHEKLYMFPYLVQSFWRRKAFIALAWNVFYQDAGSSFLCLK
jgi:type IV secretory pathway TraG/TraD family ATPase VirD4